MGRFAEKRVDSIMLSNSRTVATVRLFSYSRSKKAQGSPLVDRLPATQADVERLTGYAPSRM